jgi:hypothetical protein
MTAYANSDPGGLPSESVIFIMDQTKHGLFPKVDPAQQE